MAVSSSHRQVTGSVPDLVAQEQDAGSVGEIVKPLGTPRVNRRVLACRRGKLSLITPHLAR
ncbi:hypothetical protein GCM10020219_090370 [Nonomuraea dietziae]